MKVSTRTLVRLAQRGAAVDLDKPAPEPAPAPPPPPPPSIHQEDVARIVAEALAAHAAATPQKPLSFRFVVYRDPEGRIASITAHPINS